MPEFGIPMPLTVEHNHSLFDCGQPSLNLFLQCHAFDTQNARLSRTYIMVCDDVIVAYYTLVHLSVTQEETPKKFGRGMPSLIPAILLARLAVDQNVQGRGLGRSLFSDALKRTWAVMESGAAPVRLFVVDAKNSDALVYYKRFEMTPSPQNPMRLFLPYKKLKQIYGQP
jgi:GNAT superfamily N-acetyltransferase